METTLIDGLHQLGTLEFWEALLEGFEGLGPLVPILLAMVESIFPPLPLIAIVALNIAAHGGFLGFVYSWLGVAAGGTVVFLFWRRVVKRFFWKLASRSEQLKKSQQWVSHVDTASLFMLAVLPFTPTSFLHLPSASRTLTRNAICSPFWRQGRYGGHDGSLRPVAGQRAEKSGVSHPRPRHLGRDVLGEQEVL